jgi:preprotein translocase subunit SecE
MLVSVLMNTNTETGPGILETVKLLVTAAIVVAGIGAFYALEERSLLLSIVAVLGSLAAAVAVFMQTERGGLLWKFIQGSRVEIRKVIWPTRTEAMQTTITVFVFVLVLGVFFWLLDMGLLWITRLLTGQGS